MRADEAEKRLFFVGKAAVDHGIEQILRQSHGRKADELGAVDLLL